ncbi:50S ribosomal protein L13 [Buchnera aphidicola (Phyllaphis fagi)]|uniref:50S ribosomal protein L13 n=1 Tax=Buchnera aphidicola TaxID=9 RepID=UPI0034638D11
MKSISINANDVQKTWYYVDATEKILGRFCAQISHYLRGKHKIEYTPHIDVGDYIIVLNASKIIVTGKKKINKFYYRHTGYIGGIKKISFQDMIIKYPERVIEIAVRGMLPKGSLGRSIFRKLKVYASDSHNHIAQNPKFLNI